MTLNHLEFVGLNRYIKLDLNLKVDFIFLTLLFMGILSWIILGGLAGWIASLIMKTDASQGTVLNIVVGIVGAVIGGWIMSAIGKYGVTGFNLYSFLVALLGAVILLGIVRLIRG